MRALGIVCTVTAVTLAVAGCDEDFLIRPGNGSLRVSVATTGASFDPDGYTLSIDGQRRQAVGVNETVLSMELTFGEHSVELEGLTMNCSVAGENPRTVHVSGGQVSETTFEVTCSPAGSLEIVTETSGMTIDTNGYGFSIDGVMEGAITSNATEILFGLEPGTHTIELDGIAANCQVGGDNPRSLAISVDAVTRAEFQISCAAALLDYIAFVSERDGNKEIYAVTRTGSEFANLTRHPASDDQPSVSPDGTRIAFTSDRDGVRDIHVMAHDGSEPINLTNSPSEEETPAWSPDGRKLAFASTRDGNQDIYIMNSDGSGVIRLTSASGADRWPTWSPDGGRLAFASDRDGNWEIYVIDADGSNARNLTNDPADDESPSWAPDAPFIAFASDRDGNWEIHVVRTNGADTRNLTYERGADIMPAWAPDGARIAFATDRDGDLEIYVLNAFRPGLKKLTDDGRPDAKPAWSPLW
jgi:Tol biopolymer transport system component